MSYRLGLLALLALVTAVSSTGVVAGTPQTTNESVQLAGVYPNPVSDGDPGEFVVVRTETATPLSKLTLSDTDHSTRLPNRTLDGRAVFSTAPNRTRRLVAGPVYPLPGNVQFANSGERITLARNDTTLDSVTYSDAPEGEIGRSGDESVEWYPVGTTDFPIVSATGGTVRTFVLPDGASVPERTLASADDRILLAGYTFTSQRVADVLTDASSRGVQVEVLVDDSPVGGLTRREATVLNRLTDHNITVTVLGGERARYGYQHAKYAIVDDRALVTTENWKPAGTGGNASRGWGVVVTSPRIVTALVETFRADTGWRDGIAWTAFRDRTSFTRAQSPPANGSYPTRFEPQRFEADRVELLRAPDNAEQRLLALLDNASHSIKIEQVSIGDRRQPFLRATLRAARRGVEVKILLSGAWYVAEDNRALVSWLNERAASEGLPLTARLAEPNGRFEKIHAKGVVVDGDTVVVGSLNWNNHSARENREVALLVQGEDVAEYYTAVFRADWQGGDWRLGVGLLAVLALGALLAIVVGRRIQFDTETGVDASHGRIG